MNKAVIQFLNIIAIPKLGWVLVTLQALGYLFSQMVPVAAGMLPLVPNYVLGNGEWWRLVTFLAVPLATSPIWLFFALWFLFFCTEILEREWGAGRFTLYVLTSWAITVVYSMATGYPAMNAQHFETSLFLAVAALFPRLEVSLFFLVPIELKYLGIFSGGMVLWEFINAGAYERWHLIAIYSNFLLFFGPALLVRLKDFMRKRRFNR
jgi:membrane associated rhomboid family serine protease